MWKFIKRANYILIIAFVVFAGCGKKVKEGYSHHPAGFYYRLLSFANDTLNYQPGHIALVNAVFKTQNDSVFWDSFNDLNNRLFIKIDSNSVNPLKRFVSTCALSDSASLLIKTNDFFSQQFKSDSIPFFSKHDSVVKVNFKITAILSPKEFKKLTVNLLQEEYIKIRAYFKTDKDFQAAEDPMDFYWIEKPEFSTSPLIETGDQVTIAYEGSFLNGRFLEKSGNNFEFIYGTPDQLLKGLNYVIGKLKTGQTAKILLSSRLAFGESGSSNGIVPPFTPLVYKLKIIDVKKIK